MRPQPVTAQGLFEVLEGGLQGLGIQEVSAGHCKKLVGIYLTVCTSEQLMNAFELAEMSGIVYFAMSVLHQVTF